MPPPKTRLWALVVLLSAVAWGESSRSMAKEADRLYKAGKYPEAVELLRRAYQAEPNSVYLFNIARALDQSGEVEQALAAYREYVSQSAERTQPELVKKANLAMDRLRTMAAKAEADKALQEAEKKRLEDERKKAEEKAAEEARAAEAQRADFEAKAQATQVAEAKRVDARLAAAIVLAGTAVAGFGVELGFGLGANGAKHAFTTATTLADKSRLEAQTRTLSLVADVGLAVGVASAVAAVLVFPKGPPKGQVLLLLAPLDGGGLAAGVGGHF